jgi:deoxyribodipyrimidine photolyase-related protein
MVMHADGGIVGTKPYAASGRYISRMGNYCRDCRYKPARRTGSDGCPFTTFYWDFLLRHKARLAANPRMSIALRNADRMEKAEQREVQTHATRLRSELGVTP